VCPHLSLAWWSFADWHTSGERGDLENVSVWPTFLGRLAR
jgi:hypothetical protein